MRYALLSLLLGACNVTAGATTGGAELPARGDCPRGRAVVSSDRLSSEVGLLAPDGEVASSAVISSASSGASNVAAALSGDVTAAGWPGGPNELVLLDRYGTNVLTFLDVMTAQVRAQLAVGTGFDANPQDYLQVSEHKAYVPRLGENPSPGSEPFDAGSDLLVIEPELPEIVDSLPMPRVSGFLPSPSGIARVADDVLVTLWHFRSDFQAMADGEIVALAIADDSLRYRLQLTGLQNCGRVALSPSGALLAVACQSFIDSKGYAPDFSKSGIVLFDASVDPPREERRFAASELVGGPIQYSVEFASEGLLLFKSQTALGAEQDNRLLSLQLNSGAVTLLATAAAGPGGLGYGIAYGGMHCSPGCGDPCFVADASRGLVLPLQLAGDELTLLPLLSMAGAGLPPVDVTPFW
ncbi:MAG TPA: hypothetical protein VIW29_06665 [Polyangiaceae bacterium]